MRPVQLNCSVNYDDDDDDDNLEIEKAIVITKVLALPYPSTEISQ